MEIIRAGIESVLKVKFVGKAVLDTVENVNEITAATELDLSVENIVQMCIRDRHMKVPTEKFDKEIIKCEN